MTENPNSSRFRRGPIAWMAGNPIAANLLMFILLGGGIWTATAIQKEVFPQYELDIVEVRVDYPALRRRKSSRASCDRSKAQFAAWKESARSAAKRGKAGAKC